MINILLLIATMLSSGCSISSLHSTSPKDSPLHEEALNTLMAEEEFMEKATLSAQIIHEGLRTISEATLRHGLDKDGNFPLRDATQIRARLLEEGYLNSWPPIPPFAFTDPIQDDITYLHRYDNLDRLGNKEDVIVAQNLKIEVCEAFSRSYSSLDASELVFDFVAHGDRYPAEVYGKPLQTYAINWSMIEAWEYCEIQWVVQYND
jgi:hypothetical protein